MSAGGSVLFSVSEGIGRVRLSRPGKRNALTLRMWSSLADHLQSAARRDDVRALVIDGDGSAFCAGADLDEVKDEAGLPSPSYRSVAHRTLAALASFPRPTLAQVQGPCIGAGCAIALACDVRIASPDSSFAIPTARHGLPYDDWSIRRLVDLVGSGRAGHLMYSGARIDGPTAGMIGLVDVLADDLAAVADAYLAEVASGDVSTIEATRAVVRRSAGLDDVDHEGNLLGPTVRPA